MDLHLLSLHMQETMSFLRPQRFFHHQPIFILIWAIRAAPSILPLTLSFSSKSLVIFRVDWIYWQASLTLSFPKSLPFDRYCMPIRRCLWAPVPSIWSYIIILHHDRVLWEVAIALAQEYTLTSPSHSCYYCSPGQLFVWGRMSPPVPSRRMWEEVLWEWLTGKGFPDRHTWMRSVSHSSVGCCHVYVTWMLR